jgi:hypothetical protein
MNCVIIILGKTVTTVAKRTFLNDLPNRKAVEDSIYGLLAFVRVGEEQVVIHMCAHHSGKMLGLAEEVVCRRTYLGCHEASC